MGKDNLFYSKSDDTIKSGLNNKTNPENPDKDSTVLMMQFRKNDFERMISNVFERVFS
jgi:hypothetical protein